MVSTSYDSCQAFVLIAQGTPADAGRLSNVTGTGLLSFVLNIISAYDPWLATTLHRHAPAKVIAVAQLYEGRKRGPGGVPQLAIRIACLRQAVAEALRRGVEAVMIQQMARPVMRLGNTSLTIERLFDVDHSWVGATTLPQIIAAGRDDDPPAAIAIEFASPFHARVMDGGGHRIVPPLPTPEVVFGSMRQRLLAVTADAPLAGVDPHRLKRAIARTSAVDYDIAAVRYVIKANTDPAVPVEERIRPGLRGQVTFYCEGGREDRALLHTLARIAFYTGAGTHTALGMGLVRPTTPRQLGTWMFAHTDLVGEVPLLMRRGAPTPGEPAFSTTKTMRRPERVSTVRSSGAARGDFPGVARSHQNDPRRDCSDFLARGVSTSWLINILVWLIIGLLIGWLGSTGDRPGRSRQISLGLGLIGALLGGLLFNRFDLAAVTRGASQVSLYELLVVGIGAISVVTLGSVLQHGADRRS